MSRHNNGKHEELGDTHCGRTTFHWGERTYIMGIINASPDSFAGDGLGNNIDAAVADIVRTHDVKQATRVCKMSDAIIRGWP